MQERRRLRLHSGGHLQVVHSSHLGGESRNARSSPGAARAGPTRQRGGCLGGARLLRSASGDSRPTSGQRVACCTPRLRPSTPHARGSCLRGAGRQAPRGRRGSRHGVPSRSAAVRLQKLVAITGASVQLLRPPGFETLPRGQVGQAGPVAVGHQKIRTCDQEPRTRNTDVNLGALAACASAAPPHRRSSRAGPPPSPFGS